MMSDTDAACVSIAFAFCVKAKEKQNSFWSCTTFFLE